MEKTQISKAHLDLMAKLRKAKDSKAKTDIWYSADLSREEAEQVARDMVLSLPPGHYKLHDRKYGTNLVDTMWEIYGWMPSMFVSESMMLGLQSLHPHKVYASFTLGLDAIEIKGGKATPVKVNTRREPHYITPRPLRITPRQPRLAR